MSSARDRLVQWVVAAVVGAALALGVAWLATAPDVTSPIPTPPDASASTLQPHVTSDARGDGTAADGGPANEGATALPSTVTDAEVEAAEATTGGATALSLRADPTELRVWANTKVRLYAEPGPGVQFDRYVWHFEDGSDPVEGRAVEHVFAESVRDRHLSVEASRAGEVPVVVTLRLPVERLEVVPVDGAPEEEATLPAKSGPRLVFAGADAQPADAGEVVATAQRIQADVLVVAGSAATATVMAETAGRLAPELAVLSWPVAADTGPAQAGRDGTLAVMRNPADRLTVLPRSAGGAPVLALGDVALSAVDTRDDTVGEAELKRLRETLDILGAYKSTLLLTARPLTLLRDGELIADRAYRIYEHALRTGVGAVVSAASGVFCQGRFGALQAVAVGLVRAEGCSRPTGGSGCQPGSLTVVDPSHRGRLRVNVLTGPGFARVVPVRELPAEVGKLRR